MAYYLLSRKRKKRSSGLEESLLFVTQERPHCLAHHKIAIEIEILPFFFTITSSAPLF
jgi:hypothetical protein